jgi:hypothetical protein
VIAYKTSVYTPCREVSEEHSPSIGIYPGKKSAYTVVRPQMEAISSITFWKEELP